MKRTIFDIETDGLLPDATCVWCLVCRDADTGEVKTFNPFEIREGLELLGQSEEIIGHNIINFDLPALGVLHGFKYAGKVTDTLIMSRLIHTNLADQDREANTKPAYVPVSYTHLTLPTKA